MVAAVKAARFRIVFLSAAYLKSVNCLKELAALRGALEVSSTSQGACSRDTVEMQPKCCRDGDIEHE